MEDKWLKIRKEDVEMDVWSHNYGQNKEQRNPKEVKMVRI